MMSTLVCLYINSISIYISTKFRADDVHCIYMVHYKHSGISNSSTKKKWYAYLLAHYERASIFINITTLTLHTATHHDNPTHSNVMTRQNDKQQKHAKLMAMSIFPYTVWTCQVPFEKKKILYYIKIYIYKLQLLF